jgi:hypothetical protein
VSDPAPASTDLADRHAWPVLSPLLLGGGYLPWTTGSMRPAALVAVCNEIVHGARTRIVECGSGVSTVLLARLLRERGGGCLTALEHDRHWASVVEAQLGVEGLDGIARVLYAPLQGRPPWYDRAGSDRAPEQVDLLVVDGPPACDPGQGNSRAPALAFFEERLLADATVMLDDIERPGERRVLRDWEASSAWRFTLDQGTGVATGRRGRA